MSDETNENGKRERDDEEEDEAEGIPPNKYSKNHEGLTSDGGSGQDKVDGTCSTGFVAAVAQECEVEAVEQTEPSVGAAAAADDGAGIANSPETAGASAGSDAVAAGDPEESNVKNPDLNPGNSNDPGGVNGENPGPSADPRKDNEQPAAAMASVYPGEDGGVPDGGASVTPNGKGDGNPPSEGSISLPFIDRTGTADRPQSQQQEQQGETHANTGDTRTVVSPAASLVTTAAAAPGAHPPGVPSMTSSSPSVPNPDQVIEERGDVSVLHVGRVIGKGGEMIRDLQARSGARIDVDQSGPAGQPRTITYRGTRKTIDFAKELVRLLCEEGVSESNLPLGNAKREVLVIPSQAVGKVIGRGGEMIRELQSRSQAKIQVDHSGASGVPTDQKQVTITGTDQSVGKAKEMVLFLVANPMMDAMQSLNILSEHKMRTGSHWGTGAPYPGMPNQGANIHPQMLMGGPPGGAYGGGPGFQQQGYMPHQHGGPMGMPPQQQHPGFQQQMGGGAETDIVYAQKQFMGRIIGQKGVTINDLQRRSGTDIQINQDVPPGQDCEITVRGVRPNIETAKAMIREIIEVGPHHPYAGGLGSMDGGYGGAPGGGAGYPGGGGGGFQQQQYDFAQQQQHQQQQYGYQQPFGHQQGYDQAPYGQPAYGVPPQVQVQQHQQPFVGYGQQQQQQPQQQQYGGYGQQPPPAQAPPPPQAAQQPSWKTATTPDGQVYYYNESTGATQWEKPAGMP